MLILPTKGRPQNLKRFVRSYLDTAATLSINVIFDAADAYRYDDIQTPSHWKRISAPAGTRIGEIFNLIFKKYPDEDYYGMVADDIVPQTHLWDIVLRDSCLPDKIAWACDGLQNENLPVHPFIGGELVRKLGWWACPGLKHWYVDNVWKNLANALNCGVYLPNIKMTHLHPANGSAPYDRTYNEQPSHTADEICYINFLQNDFQQTVDRVKNTL